MVLKNKKISVMIILKSNLSSFEKINYFDIELWWSNCIYRVIARSSHIAIENLKVGPSTK